MSVKIRLARGGCKKKPFYRMVAADVKSPRNGRFLEKLGTYNPMLPKSHSERVQLKQDRINYWFAQGAQPTYIVAKLLERLKFNLPPYVVKQLDIKKKNYKTRPSKKSEAAA